MIKVVFAPEVEEDLYELIEILVEKEYLGTYAFAISYVEDLVLELKRKAPAFFERYGKELQYVTYQRNANTTWYVFFSLIEENVYFVKCITNNHAAGQYIV